MSFYLNNAQLNFLNTNTATKVVGFYHYSDKDFASVDYEIQVGVKNGKYVATLRLCEH
jgi:hypothetical protein